MAAVMIVVFVLFGGLVCVYQVWDDISDGMFLANIQRVFADTLAETQAMLTTAASKLSSSATGLVGGWYAPACTCF